jgi:autotransporter-associated beta strand protein
VSGELIGTGGSLVKIGSGTLTFSNTSLLFYRGPTTVNGGTLEADSTLRSNSVIVNAGGTLSGTGAAAPFAQINFGGTLAPGNPANPTGTFTMDAGLAFQSGAIYLVTLSGANAANTNVSFGAAASLAGTVQGAVGAGGAVLTSYDILHADGGLGGTTFSGVSVPNYIATLTYSATDVPRRDRGGAGRRQRAQRQRAGGRRRDQ